MGERDRNDERLSAYIDDTLEPQARQDLEALLTQDAKLRADLEEMRTTVELLRTLPQLRAPRDFTLDPAVYGRKTRSFARLGVRFAGVMGAVAALVLAVGFFLLSGVLPGTPESPAAPVAVQMPVAPSRPLTPQAGETGMNDLYMSAEDTEAPPGGVVERAEDEAQVSGGGDGGVVGAPSPGEGMNGSEYQALGAAETHMSASTPVPVMTATPTPTDKLVVVDETSSTGDLGRMMVFLGVLLSVCALLMLAASLWARRRR